MRTLPLLWTVILCSGCELGEVGDSQTRMIAKKKAIPLFAEIPAVTPNPQRRVPLVALVDVVATTPVTGTLEINDGQGNAWTIAGPETPALEMRLIAHSMRPDRRHEIRVRLTDPLTQATELSEPLEFLTPPLPKSFPPLEVTLSQPERMEPGVLLFPLNLWRDDESVMEFGYLIAVDEKGEVIWFLQSGHRTADVRLLRNGHLMVITVTRSK